VTHRQKDAFDLLKKSSKVEATKRRRFHDLEDTIETFFDLKSKEFRDVNAEGHKRTHSRV
jgi:hypothetical protein